MKTVYIVTEVVAYGPTEVLEVFDNEEQAIRCCNEYLDKYHREYGINGGVNYKVLERTVLTKVE
jgi:hypothetical protein